MIAIKIIFFNLQSAVSKTILISVLYVFKLLHAKINKFKIYNQMFLFY